MTRLLTILSILALACTAQLAPVTATPTPASTAETSERPTQYETALVTAETVNIRFMDGRVTGEYAERDMPLYGRVVGNWFVLVTMGHEWGKVWIGCVDVESELGCEAK